MKKILLFNLFAFIMCHLNAQEEARLMRFPAIHGNQIVFSYAGDLYTVDKLGGTARKLTTDIGYEMFARFSPNGKKIAFTAQYDGNTEVYSMPSEGGEPVRLTYTAALSRDAISDRMGPNNIVMTWRDDSSIVYRSRKQTFNDFKGQLFLASTNGGLSEELPLPSGGFCSYNKEKTKLAYNRVFREFRTWKYYKGGMADDIWIYDFSSKKTINITNNDAQDIMPMWVGDKIYFISDRDRIMNLFCYDITSKETKKVTNFTEYDIKFPSLGDNAIVFENSGYIYVFDLTTQKSEKVKIIITDDQVSGRDKLKDASEYINSSSISPDGKRISFDARGDIFTVPVKSGITRNLTKTSGTHDRNVAWSPDGKNIAFISDITGEDEIYIMNENGTSEPIQLTKNSDTYKYYLEWSPNSKYILWADKKLRLQYIDISTKIVTQVDYSKDGEFTQYCWSPDSKWLAYTFPTQSSMNKIYLYELSSKAKCEVTDGWYDSGSPSFSSDGKFLFFSSDRDFNPTYSWTEWNHAYTDMSKVYFVTLAKATINPLKPENDEVVLSKEEEKETAKELDKKDTKGKTKTTETTITKDIKIDTTGIKNRIVVLPIDAGRYFNITTISENVYYIKRSETEKKASLMVFDLKNKKETKLGNCNNYEITADHKKMFLRKDGYYYVIDLPKASLDLKESVDVSNMKIWVDQKAEWKEIYNECWRQMRDFFYDPDMHGVDWNNMKEKYAVLLPYINHRADLTYVIGELIGELNVGHAYIGGGDEPELTSINTGLLGATVLKDKSGYFKIEKILEGENWRNKARSPLTEVGVDVNEGEYIIAINGTSVKETGDIYELLVNTAGSQVELTVNSTPSKSGSRKVIIVPISDEAELYYYNWVQKNIKKVSDATNGQVGYVHIPDMSVVGLNEFAKYFYPQKNKKAFIIDDRGNGGGNVSPMILDRLMRDVAIMGMSRNTAAEKSPESAVNGPIVCLIDNYSASDGDLFPYKFKKLGLGKLIGKRSWGGVIGIRGTLPLMDGGYLMRPEFGHYSSDGEGWIIEGYGVDPDIEVDNDPAKEYMGEDEQLNAAIKHIQEELKNYKELPGIPEFPDK
ncbi:MAG TPA: PDZ domain-containing protein [Bacteroidales bacterium]|nr:PDZ domain-containing protein [Bacteroidales bacterium]